MPATDLRWLLRAEQPSEVRMAVEDAVRIYDVIVEHASLTTVSIGRKGPGYRVRLLGPLDGRWFATFGNVQRRLAHWARFQLDRLEGAVCFPHEIDAPPTELIDKLEQLDDLVSQTNFVASH
jgi:hypothetical protein